MDGGERESQFVESRNVHNILESKYIDNWKRIVLLMENFDHESNYYGKHTNDHWKEIYILFIQSFHTITIYNHNCWK
jgi:hypothetical protein